MKLDTRPTRTGEDLRWEIAMGIALGYDLHNPVDIRRMPLPMHPFTIVGPFVVVRHVIMDENGNARYIRADNTIGMSTHIRWIPRSFRRHAKRFERRHPDLHLE